MINSNGPIKEPTITRNIRMSPTLLARITLLAGKRRWSVNAWIVNTLVRESRLRDGDSLTVGQK
jgi:predicted HicB family RNase H-like nuclease